jgi:hypothetical protein
VNRHWATTNGAVAPLIAAPTMVTGGAKWQGSGRGGGKARKANKLAGREQKPTLAPNSGAGARAMVGAVRGTGNEAVWQALCWREYLQHSLLHQQQQQQSKKVHMRRRADEDGGRQGAQHMAHRMGVGVGVAIRLSAEGVKTFGHCKGRVRTVNTAWSHALIRYGSWGRMLRACGILYVGSFFLSLFFGAWAIVATNTQACGCTVPACALVRRARLHHHHHHHHPPSVPVAMPAPLTLAWVATACATARCGPLCVICIMGQASGACVLLHSGHVMIGRHACVLLLHSPSLYLLICVSIHLCACVCTRTCACVCVCTARTRTSAGTVLEQVHTRCFLFQADGTLMYTMVHGGVQGMVVYAAIYVCVLCPAAVPLGCNTRHFVLLFSIVLF